MLSLLSHVPTRRLLLRDAPVMVTSLIIADLFYHWHSFLRETGGFLATWLVLDLVVAGFSKVMKRAEA